LLVSNRDCMFAWLPAIRCDARRRAVLRSAATRRVADQRQEWILW